MARAALLALAAVAVSLALGACGDSDSGSGKSSAGPRSAAGISTHDKKVFLRIQIDVREWKKAAAPWAKAVHAGDRERFLAVHQRSLRPLSSAVADIERGSRQVGDPSLREKMVPVGQAYRLQYDGIVDLGEAIRVGNQAAMKRGLVKLRRASRQRRSAAKRLADRAREIGRF